jgi:hypothetical protein
LPLGVIAGGGAGSANWKDGASTPPSYRGALTTWAFNIGVVTHAQPANAIVHAIANRRSPLRDFIPASRRPNFNPKIVSLKVNALSLSSNPHQTSCPVCLLDSPETQS